MKKLLFIFMFVFAASLMSAQTLEVKGVVKDAKQFMEQCPEAFELHIRRE